MTQANNGRSSKQRMMYRSIYTVIIQLRRQLCQHEAMSPIHGLHMRSRADGMEETTSRASMPAKPLDCDASSPATPWI